MASVFFSFPPNRWRTFSTGVRMQGRPEDVGGGCLSVGELVKVFRVLGRNTQQKTIASGSVGKSPNAGKLQMHRMGEAKNITVLPAHHPLQSRQQRQSLDVPFSQQALLCPFGVPPTPFLCLSQSVKSFRNYINQAQYAQQ